MAMTISQVLGLTQGPNPTPVSIADIVSGIQSQYSGSPQSTYQFQTGLGQYGGNPNLNQYPSNRAAVSFTPGKFDLAKMTGVQNNAAINAAIASGSGYRPNIDSVDSQSGTPFYNPMQPGESYQDFVDRTYLQRLDWENQNPNLAKAAGFLPGTGLVKFLQEAMVSEHAKQQASLDKVFTTGAVTPALEKLIAENAYVQDQGAYAQQLADLAASARPQVDLFTLIQQNPEVAQAIATPVVDNAANVPAAPTESWSDWSARMDAWRAGQEQAAAQQAAQSALQAIYGSSYNPSDPNAGESMAGGSGWSYGYGGESTGS